MARTSEQLTNEEIEIVEQLSDVANSNYVYRDMNGDFVGMAGGSGSGDVTGPASAVDNNFASFNLTTGKIIKDSGYNAASFTAANSPITGATKTKITYDAKGLVTAGADATTADIAASTDKNYVTDAQQAIISATTASYTTADETKVDYITVTSAVNLDTMATAVAALDQATILKGTWDASAGTFPGAGVAQAGWTYIVSVPGTVDGVSFSVNDRILAIVDNASTTTFSGNWFKLDYTDQVLSVAGKTGTVTLDTNDVSDVTNKRYVTDANLTTIGNQSGTNTGDNAVNSLYSGLAASKENTITGTSSTDYWNGAKTFVDFATSVRAAVLTGLSLATGTAITAADSVLVAFGKLQKQLTDLIAVAVTLTGSQTLTNKTLTSPVINLGSDATGDMYYRNGSGILTRLPIGTSGQVVTVAGGLPTYATPSGGGGGAKQHKITIPGEQILDTANYQGLYLYNDTGASITISNVAVAVGTAAAGSGAAFTVQLYKSSGTASDGLNTNAVALFSTAIALGTSYTSLTNVPTTATVESGRRVTLRVTASAGATNKASNAQIIITYT